MFAYKLLLFAVALHAIAQLQASPTTGNHHDHEARVQYRKRKPAPPVKRQSTRFNREKLISELQQNVRSLESQLEHDMSEQKQRLLELEKKLDQQAQNNRELELKLIEATGKGTHKILHQQENVTRAATVYNTAVRENNPASGTFVGFLAEPIETRYYNQNDRILFDHALQNPSGSYNETSSVFACRYSGYYFFSVTILNIPAQDGSSYPRADATLVVGGTEIFRVLAAVSNNGHHQASMSAVLHCEQGQEAYVQSPLNAQIGIHNGPFSAFSGYLIRMDTE